MADQAITERVGARTIAYMYVIGYEHSRRDAAHATPPGSDLALCGSLVTKQGGSWPAIESVWLDGARRCDDCARRTYGRRLSSSV